MIYTVTYNSAIWIFTRWYMWYTHWCRHPLAKTVPLRLRSQSSTVIAVSRCLCRQTATVLHQHLCKLPSHSLILNYQITHSNWTIWFPWGLGLALSQKFFLPCTIWWAKCNAISVLVCAWVVSVGFLMMLRLSQNKWKYLSDAPWKERWGKLPVGFRILTQWTTNTSEEQAGFIAAWS